MDAEEPGLGALHKGGNSTAELGGVRYGVRLRDGDQSHLARTADYRGANYFISGRSVSSSASQDLAGWLADPAVYAVVFASLVISLAGLALLLIGVCRDAFNVRRAVSGRSSSSRTKFDVGQIGSDH